MMIKNNFRPYRQPKKSNNYLIMYVSFVIVLVFLIGCKRESVSPPEPKPVDPPVLVIEKANYYVAPDGSDSNPGTIDKPFKSWDKIVSVVKPGDLVYLRGGIYYKGTRINYAACYLAGKSGNPGKYIRMWAYPGETPVLDCKDLKTASGVVGLRLMNSNYWHIKGIEIKNVYQIYNTSTKRGTDHVGLAISNSSYNIIENIKIHDIGGPGCGIAGTSTENIVKNSDFYKNYDPYTVSSTTGADYHGGNADGIHISALKGTVNTITGCRFSENSDDGIDMWQTDGIVKLDSCWSFNNGLDHGDGMGFKYGETTVAYEDVTKRYTSHCLAYNNKGMGFDQNDADAKMEFYNNFAYKNVGVGYYMSKFNLKNTFINNINYKNNNPKALLTAESVNTNNSWNGITISDADFTSVDMTGIDGPRKANGNLPDVNFLRPSSNSIVIDKGIDVGFPFYGKAPDLGIFELKK